MAETTERLLIALYLDENVDEKRATALRRYGYEVLTTREAERTRALDEEQLELAAAKRRTLLSRDIADSAPLHERWSAQGLNIGAFFDARGRVSAFLAAALAMPRPLQRRGDQQYRWRLSERQSEPASTSRRRSERPKRHFHEWTCGGSCQFLRLRISMRNRADILLWSRSSTSSAMIHLRYARPRSSEVL